ncbi:MAG: N-6 DNA methylase [Candidatus Coatesbacteria bacterium]|nr:N-6 DNA methylase [Candidatus Coatesbacteria bacterium]
MPKRELRCLCSGDDSALRIALRKVKTRLIRSMRKSESELSPSDILTLAGVLVTYLARTSPSALSSGNWDGSALPRGLEQAITMISPGELSLEGESMHVAVNLLRDGMPGEIWFTDDVLGWLYESCCEGESARRMRGQYYTPAWLAEMLIGHCLEALMEDEGGLEGQLDTINVLDPACGSGKFLLSAYNALTESDSPCTRPGQSVRKRLFGIDIDRKAIALAELGLALLDLDRGGGFETEFSNFSRSDFLDRSLEPMFGTVSGSGIKARLLMAPVSALTTAFDMVIGNPPYLGFHHHPPKYRQSVLKDYSVYDGKADVFYYFIERGLEFLREGGVLGYVVPRYWLGADKAMPLRRFLSKSCELVYLLDFDEMQIFGKAGVQVCILILRKRLPRPSNALAVHKAIGDRRRDSAASGRFPVAGIGDRAQGQFEVPQSRLGDFWVLIPEEEHKLMSMIDRAADCPLGEAASVSPGVITGLDKIEIKSERSERSFSGVFVLSHDEVERLRLLPIERDLLKPWIKNSNVSRWSVGGTDEFILYLDSEPDWDSMPNISQHLMRHREALERRYEIPGSDRPWWRPVRPRRSSQFEGATPKIVVPYKAAQSRFAVDYGRHYCSADVYCINPIEGVLPEYICCLLNSRLLEFYFRRIAKKMGHVYEYYAHTLFRLPIKVAPISDQLRFKAMHDEIVAALSGRDAGSSGSDRMAQAEQALGQAVFDLYGLDARDFGSNP